MNIVFRCPECNKRLRASAGLGGMDINCPACESGIYIPFESDAAENKHDDGGVETEVPPGH